MYLVIQKAVRKKLSLLFALFISFAANAALFEMDDKEKFESFRSIWAENAGETYVLRSGNYLTTIRFPEFGEVGEIEISVTRLVGIQEMIYFGNVRPEVTSYGRIQFIFTPKPGSLPHVTLQPPETSPPLTAWMLDRRGKFVVEIDSYGKVTATPFDNSGIPSNLLGRQDWAEAEVAGNTRTKPRPLLDTLSDNFAWRLAAGIEHRRPLTCREVIEGKLHMAKLGK